MGIGFFLNETHDYALVLLIPGVGCQFDVGGGGRCNPGVQHMAVTHEVTHAQTAALPGTGPRAPIGP